MQGHILLVESTETNIEDLIYQAKCNNGSLHNCYLLQSHATDCVLPVDTVYRLVYTADTSKC